MTSTYVGLPTGTDKQMDHIFEQEGPHRPILPTEGELTNVRRLLHKTLTDEPRNDTTTREHIDSLVKGLNQSSQSSRYYGFVTGGATPASRHADNLVTQYDQNVQVHLPRETIATEIEDAALKMLCELYELDHAEWNHRTFTTGATASNIIGLTMGRQAVVEMAGRHLGGDDGEGDPAGPSIAHSGVKIAMDLAEIDKIQVLTTGVHSSVRKAASIIGLGHYAVRHVGRQQPGQSHLFDFAKLEDAMKVKRTASIIVVTCSEVGQGLFATENRCEYQTLRYLADTYKAWIHVDAAIGLQARILLHDRDGNTEYERIMDGVDGIEFADSIAGDAHKLLNVPYDCGIFLSRHLRTAIKVFENPGDPYLSGGAMKDGDIPSPLNIGIENSRRFRALPVYANLVRYGRRGYDEMLKRQINLARKIAGFIQSHQGYELLPVLPIQGQDLQALRDNQDPMTDAQKRDLEAFHTAQRNSVFVIVCFRAVNGRLNENLSELLKQNGKIYVSRTEYELRPAVRIAISNWQVEVQRDYDLVCQALREVYTR